MKRLGALIGITAFATLSLSYYLGESVAIICTFTFSIAILAMLFVKKFRKYAQVIVSLIVVVLSLLTYITYTETTYKSHIRDYGNKNVYVNAVLEEPPFEKYDNYYYMLDVVSIDGNSCSEKMYLKYEKDIKIETGSLLCFYCVLRPANNDYYITQGYNFYSNMKSLNVKYIRGYRDSVQNIALDVRNRFTKVINGFMGKKLGSVCNAIAVGDRINVDPQVNDSFRKSGVSHVLVVSGMHMSIVSMMVIFILSKLFRKKIIYCPLSILAVLFYMVMTGFTYTVVRSGIMVIIMIISKMIFRKPDPLNSLGIAVLIIVLANPYSAANTGLILSVASTAGIIVFADKTNAYICTKLQINNRLIKAVVGIISVVLSANLFVLPLNIIFFDSISVMTMVTNLLITPCLSVFLIMLLIGGFLGLFAHPYLYYPFLYVAKIITEYMVYVTDSIANLPFSTISTTKPFVYVWLAISVGLILCALIVRNYSRTIPAAVCVSAILLVISIVLNYMVNYDRTTISVYDVGNGVSVSIKDGGSVSVLSCGSDYTHKNIAEKLESQTGSIDFLSVTSGNTSDSLNVKDITSEFDLKNVLIYDYCIPQSSIGKGCRKITVFDKDYIVKNGNLKVTYLVRKNKVYTYAEINGVSMLILPAFANCKMIDEQYRNPDIVVVNYEVYSGYLINTKLLIMSCTEENYCKINYAKNINSDKLYTTFNGDYIADVR